MVNEQNLERIWGTVKGATPGWCSRRWGITRRAWGRGCPQRGKSVRSEHILSNSCSRFALHAGLDWNLGNANTSNSPLAGGFRGRVRLAQFLLILFSQRALNIALPDDLADDLKRRLRQGIVRVDLVWRSFRCNTMDWKVLTVDVKALAGG